MCTLLRGNGSYQIVFCIFVCILLRSNVLNQIVLPRYQLTGQPYAVAEKYTYR